MMCTQGLTPAGVWDALMLTRLERRRRLSALGCLIKGLQGREQATRVKITRTHYTEQQASESEIEVVDGLGSQEMREGDGEVRE